MYGLYSPTHASMTFVTFCTLSLTGVLENMTVVILYMFSLVVHGKSMTLVMF